LRRPQKVSCAPGATENFLLKIISLANKKQLTVVENSVANVPSSMANTNNNQKKKPSPESTEHLTSTLCIYYFIIIIVSFVKE
jgi:hypothetical protein